MTEVMTIEGISDYSTRFLESELDQGSRGMIAHPTNLDRHDLAKYIANKPLSLGRINRFLGDNWSLNEMALLDNDSSMAFVVLPDEMPDQFYRASISNVCEVLRDWSIVCVGRNDVSIIKDVCSLLRVCGNDDLADRVAYFASNEDLADGDVPLTGVSARAFLSFFGKVESEGKISLTCSPEGWLCVAWRFSDKRRASLWFINDTRVMFAATDANGDFIEIDGGGEVSDSQEVMDKLIDAGLLTWSLDSRIFHMTTMLPDTAVSEILPKMEYRWRAHSYSDVMRPFFQLTGASTSTPQTDESKFTALLRP